MKYTVRVVVSALMLAGVCVLAAAIVLAVATALVVAVIAGGLWSKLAGVVVVGALVAVALGVLRARRRPRKIAGVRVTSEEHPLLWVEVYGIAEGLGIGPPDELLLVPDANVVAFESKTWLRRRPGLRRLRLGVPLLAGLTERQLRAVIAQDLYRCWGPNSFVRVIDRGKVIMAQVIAMVGEDSVAGRIVGRYGRAYVAVSRPITVRCERNADLLSAELAGNGATSAAIREAAVVRKGWDAFVAAYAVPAAAMGRRPEDLFAGFACFFKDPTRRAQLVEVVDETALQHQSTYDTHLSLGDRVAAIASLPDDGIHDKSGRALDMLRNPDRELRRVEDAMFRDSDLRPATWGEIATEAGCAIAHEDALKLVWLGREGGLGPTLSVETLLDLVRHGLAEEMVRPLLGDGVPLEAERQFAGRLVTAFLATAAIESGTASYQLSWAAPWQLVDDRGEADDLPRLVDAALADPVEVGPLERWLKTHQLGMALELGSDPQPTLVS